MQYRTIQVGLHLAITAGCLRKGKAGLPWDEAFLPVKLAYTGNLLRVQLVCAAVMESNCLESEM